ncbi:glycoside hydrolase/deacetylase [Hortaea werneckii]|nr:glycoside hydrolase/deacetylase [Hortaea werneckii]
MECLQNSPAHRESSSAHDLPAFLTLPWELREQILTDVVRDIRPLVPKRGSQASTWALTRPDVTRACKQLRAEGLSLYYATNTFWLDIRSVCSNEAIPGEANTLERSLPSYRAWCTATGHDNFLKIRSFVFEEPSGAHYRLNLLNSGKFTLTPSERPIAECTLTRVCRGIVRVVQETLEARDERGLFPEDIELYLRPFALLCFKIMSSGGAKWPDGASAAIAFTMDNMGEAADLDRGLWPESQPIGSHYSVKEVLPQFLDLLRKYDISGTYFMEAWNFTVYPEAIHSLLEAGHEVSWHAWRHEAWGKLDEKAEQENFIRSFGQEGFKSFPASEAYNQRLYQGFRPPGGTVHGQRTLKLCQSNDIRYISPAADEAAMLKIDEEQSHIAVLPFKWSTVDAYYYMESFSGLRKMKGTLPEETQPPDVLISKYKDEIDQAIAKGGFLSLLFHPFLTDMPDRTQAMESVLQYLALKRDQGTIWLARCGEIADWLHAHPNTVGNDPKWDASTWR